jgi:hypothetical protein
MDATFYIFEELEFIVYIWTQTVPLAYTKINPLKTKISLNCT